ncbi:MAG: DUF2924 domain-containing protein [Planctomycetes bacterium]|nr:DUF2924 domain-containing protein [Planctomycetota bacterium]
MSNISVNTTTNDAGAAPPAYASDLVAQVDDALRSLDDLTSAQLTTKFGELYGYHPPIRDRRWKHRRCAFAVQRQIYGEDLSDHAKEKLREIQRLLGIDLASVGPTVRSKVSRPSRHDHLQPGTALERRWRDQTIRVLVRQDGFEWDGRIFKSLSAIAKAVTKQHWNGNLWFGLVSRSRKQ